MNDSSMSRFCPKNKIKFAADRCDWLKTTVQLLFYPLFGAHFDPGGFCPAEQKSNKKSKF